MGGGSSRGRRVRIVGGSRFRPGFAFHFPTLGLPVVSRFWAMSLLLSFDDTRTFFDATAQSGFGSLLPEIRESELRAFIDQPFLPASFYDVMLHPDLLPYEAHALRMGVEPSLLHRVRWQAKRDLDGGV